MPRGMRAPKSRNFLGFFKKSTTSISSSFASFKSGDIFKEHAVFKSGKFEVRAAEAERLVDAGLCLAEHEPENDADDEER